MGSCFVANGAASALPSPFLARHAVSRHSRHSCPGSFVGTTGDRRASRSRRRHRTAKSGTRSRGGAELDPAKVRISGWAHTDRYYPQPLLTELFTCVGNGGSWSFFTHAGKRVIVLLVDDTYVGPSGPAPLPSSIDYHPATDRGVLAWAELPASRTVRFAGRAWWVKDSDPMSRILVPASSRRIPPMCSWTRTDLHLRTGKRGARVDLRRGRPRPVARPRRLRVPGGERARRPRCATGVRRLLVESPTREIESECSPALTGLENGCQYVVQPLRIGRENAGSSRCRPAPRPIASRGVRIG